MYIAGTNKLKYYKIPSKKAWGINLIDLMKTMK